MRIIGGIHRSRHIDPPDDYETTRPITDRVKVAAFDRLANVGMFEEGHALDIFAGTGSLGIEALSRGSETCTFVERDRRAREILSKNLDLLRLTDHATILSANALTTGWLATLPHKPLRVVFCDPPYPMMEDDETRPQILDLIRAVLPLLEPGGVVMLRTPDHITPDPVAGFSEPKHHTYGSMMLTFYQAPLPEPASE